MIGSTENEVVTLGGFIERIIFENELSGYAVLRMKTAPPDEEEFTAIGNIAGLNEGGYIELYGKWVNNPRFGRQFEAEYYKIAYPSTPEGLKKYLGSGIIPGIGKTYAKRILSRFGTKALDILETDPTRIYEIPGIGKKKAGPIAAALRRHADERKILVVLMQYGISPSKSQKIIKYYGERAPEVIRTDPYRLAEDIHGIGFLTADKIAINLGVPKDSVERARAGIIHCLQKASEEGHVASQKEKAIAEAAQLLEIPEERIKQGLARAILEGKLIEEEAKGRDAAYLYLRRLYSAEEKAAEIVCSLISEPPPKAEPKKLSSLLEAYEKRERITLTEKQREAVLSVFSQHLAVITGGPGTGKTTIVRAVTEIAEAEGLEFKLAASTGRAAKRLSESTGQPASTIHRLLEYNPHLNRYTRDEKYPLETDLVIIDEASMIDLELFSAIMRALLPSMRLVLVGDIDQLPSVGPGRVLADIIDLKYARTTRLDAIFRQEEGGSIVVNAHRIKNGQMPITAAAQDKAKMGEFFFIERNEASDAASLVVEMAAKRIPEKFGFDSFEQTQVLSPMRKGETGIINLNQVLQARLNPTGEEYIRGSKLFRMGDKVMQTVNDYDREVFNGDVGRITEIRKADKIVVVEFSGREVIYEADQLDGLELAYAMTIHKSQGSEYEAAVIPLLSAHYMLLRRDLIYTAVTRAKKLVVIVGQKKALSMAVERKGSEYRVSLFTDRILSLLESKGIK